MSTKTKITASFALGLDHEFLESILVPQITISGSLGFKLRADVASAERLAAA